MIIEIKYHLYDGTTTIEKPENMEDVVSITKTERLSTDEARRLYLIPEHINTPPTA